MWYVGFNDVVCGVSWCGVWGIVVWCVGYHDVVYVVSWFVGYHETVVGYRDVVCWVS